MKIYKLLFTKLLVFFILILLLTDDCITQEFAKSKGRDFWVTFLPNFHNNRGSNTDILKYGDSLYLFIVAYEPTSGTITYKNRNNRTFTQNFTINNINEIYIFKQSYWDFELLGFNDSGNLIVNSQNEKISNQSFHIVTDKDVTVYAHSQSVMTSDAFLVLPTEALGTEYLILTYNSDGSTIVNYINSSSTPSQFAIVATEDNTNITIIPSTKTHSNDLKTQRIKLNRGNVYLVQAKIDSENWTRDLSGTEIISDKPISVFAGHQRATIPISLSGKSPSRDFICEQMPPIKSWGKNALIVPYPQPKDTTKNDTDNYDPDIDIYRIIAAYDNTELYINDELVATLNKGELYEDNLMEPLFVTASAPILVAQYKKTSQTEGIGALSDPFMMIIPPVEQFDKFYRFINIQAYEWKNDTIEWSKVYIQQYLTIVAPENAIKSLRLNGSAIPPANFKPIPNTEYYYTWLKMRDGASVISADEPFGIYVYGYGIANSYGYFGGMNFKRLDFQPPEITASLTCYKIDGVIYDSTANDSKITEIYTPIESLNNVTLTIEAFKPPKESVKFEAQLNNIYFDGSFTIIAKDSAGLTSKKEFDIPGFTLKPTRNEKAEVTIIDTIVRKDFTHCFEIEIENYGKFNRILSAANFKSQNSYFYVSSPLPFNFSPGDKLPIKICFESKISGKYIDTLVISDDCGERELAYLIFNALADDNPPQFSTHNDPCNQEFIIFLTDSLNYDYGIEKIEILENINCSINIEQFNPRVSICKVNVINPFFDAYYKIAITDSAGFQTTVENSIKGFTIELVGFENSSNINEFKQQRIGSIWCDSISIYNYGKFPFKIEQTYFKQNTLFSSPQSQYPIIIEPGDTVSLFLCYHPLSIHSNPDYDTLEIEFNCNVKSLILKGEGTELNYTAKSRCGISLRMDINKVSDKFYIKPFTPNPSSNIITTEFSLPKNETIDISLYNSLGQIVFNDLVKLNDNGIYDYFINISSLPPGIYFIKMQSLTLIHTEKIIISR